MVKPQSDKIRERKPLTKWNTHVLPGFGLVSRVTYVISSALTVELTQWAIPLQQHCYQRAHPAVAMLSIASSSCPLDPDPTPAITRYTKSPNYTIPSVHILRWSLATDTFEAAHPQHVYPRAA